jgi:lysophospholipase L1-like esterase
MTFITAVLAEIAVRIDDRMERGIPFLDNPTYESELRVRRDGILEGRPFGHYQKWQLNSWGFRGPEIGLEKRTGCDRIMVIGASEMFGLYESPGNDFAAALRSKLTGRRCAEVINTAMAGMSLGAARIYWSARLAQFRPDLVLLYVTPALQINDTFPPAPPAAASKPGPAAKGGDDSAPRIYRSRLIDWLRQYIHLPDSMHDRSVRREIDQEINRHPAQWVLHSAPEQGLQSFSYNLGALVDEIAQSGAHIVLMTHAERVRSATIEDNPHDALSLEANNPHVAPKAQVEFDELANARVRQFAEARNLPLVDLDKLLTGCRECFFDPVHFTDAGASRAATAVAAALGTSDLIPKLVTNEKDMP